MTMDTAAVTPVAAPLRITRYRLHQCGVKVAFRIYDHVPMLELAMPDPWPLESALLPVPAAEDLGSS